MPTALVRLQQTGHSHFITFTCYRRMKHLTSSQACSAVLRALENTRRRYSLRVFGFVLMPEHVHLLLSEPGRGSLARALQSLKSASARMARGAAMEHAGERTAFWQTRYYDRYMRDYDEFSQKLRYIHRNPVKRGLCSSPEQWPWSSFRHYWNGADVGVEIESEWTARARQFQAR
ncbi:MAG: transposase [Candidatus Korobacteraceae bacterium]